MVGAQSLPLAQLPRVAWMLVCSCFQQNDAGSSLGPAYPGEIPIGGTRASTSVLLSVAPLLEGHLSRRQPPPICGPEPAPVGLTGPWQCSPPASGRVTLASLTRFSDFPISGVLSFLPHLLLSFQCSFWSGGAPWVEEDTVHLGQAVKQGATGFSLGSVIVACLGSAILAGWFFKSKVGQAYQLCLVWGHSCFQSMS